MELTILGLKCRIEIIIASVIVGIIIASFTICGCTKDPENEKEGFQKISDIANASGVNHNMNADSKGSWMQKALGFASDMGYNTVLSRHANFKGTEVPLNNTMFYFKNNQIKPECCPSTYSSSNGCVCTSISQLNYLNQRGGNRTQASEF